MVGKLCGGNRGNRAQLAYNGVFRQKARYELCIYIYIYIHIYIYVIWGEFAGAVCYARGVGDGGGLRGQREPCSACV